MVTRPVIEVTISATLPDNVRKASGSQRKAFCALLATVALGNVPWRSTEPALVSPKARRWLRAPNGAEHQWVTRAPLKC